MNNTQTIFTIIVGVVLTVGAYIFFETDLIKEQAPTSVTQNNPTSQNTSQKTPEEDLSYLHSRSEVAPDTGQAVSVKFDALPTSLKLLIPDQYKDLIKASSTVFSDRKNGYTVEFEYEADIVVAHNYYRKYTVSQYEFVDGKKVNNAAIYTVQNAEYTFWMDFLKISDDLTKITINAKAR